MARTAFIVGGSGQIGIAVARALLAEGWAVAIADRGGRPLPSGLEEAQRPRLDREEPGALAAALGSGADLVVDAVAYDRSHALQLVEVSSQVGCLVAISSASVYTDLAGRTLDEATDDADYPELPRPIPETQPTVAPGEATYSTRKVAMERVLLDEARSPVTVIRPCAVHGPGSRHLREWHFLKRALDERPVVILGHRGESIFHTTSVGNIAELVRLAAESSATRVLNCGDPDPPAVREIGRLVGATVEHEPIEVLLPGSAPTPGVGDTPWSIPSPIVLDMARARAELGYHPVTSYPAAVAETCGWLSEAVRGRDWREVLPDLARYWARGFDYAAEDAYLAAIPTR